LGCQSPLAGWRLADHGPVDYREFAPAHWPDVLVLVDDKWCTGELRAWIRAGDGWDGYVKYQTSPGQNYLAVPCLADSGGGSALGRRSALASVVQVIHHRGGDLPRPIEVAGDHPGLGRPN
jgi:hypothetical protein